MKALLLGHPEADYGAAYLWNGLNIVLGEGNVLDTPLKMYYHGIAVNDIDIPEQGIFGGSIVPPPWLPARPPYELDIAFIHALKDGFFDMVVVESPRLYAVRTFEAIKDSIPDTTKVILHDGEDGVTNNIDVLGVRPDVYLKRELLKEYPIDFAVEKDGKRTRVMSFPFSAPDQLAEACPLSWEECEYSVAAMFGNTWPDRRRLCEALLDVPDAFVAYGNGMNHATGEHNLKAFDDYIDILRQSRFGASMRGHGRDTCRMWEVAVTTGLLTDALDIHIPNPFKPGFSCYQYGSPEEAAVLSSAFRRESQFCRDVRTEGIRHARQHHTNSARVKWMLEKIFN